MQANCTDHRFAFSAKPPMRCCLHIRGVVGRLRQSKEQATVRRGFTLLEVLTVVGIVSVLLTLLIPALTKARCAQNTVSCLSNLRQISMALRLYAEDERRLPNPGTTG